MKRIHYFNPGHENAILNQLPSYTAPASITTMMRELASLPAWYGADEDVVLVDENFNKEYHDSLLKKGFHLANVLFSKELRKYNEAAVCMWGISPQGLRVFEAHNRDYFLNLKLPTWNEKFVYLSSREIARDVLQEIKSSSTLFDNIVLPVFCANIEEVEEFIRMHSDRRFLAKSPYSSSGRGLLWLPLETLTRVEYQILSGMLKKQSKVSLEPVYKKITDFAMEFMSDGKGTVTFVGYSYFMTNEKGAYQGNYMASQAKILEKLTHRIDYSILESTISLLQNILANHYGSLYSGCIGVDMMIVEENNSYILHPCVEINMRYNMGYLSIKLFENFISDSSVGQYILDYDPKGTLLQTHCEMQKSYPLIVEDGKVKSGYMSLCPIEASTKYRAYILVSD